MARGDTVGGSTLAYYVQFLLPCEERSKVQYIIWMPYAQLSFIFKCTEDDQNKSIEIQIYFEKCHFHRYNICSLLPILT